MSIGSRTRVVLLATVALLAWAGSALAEEQPAPAGIYRGLLEVVKFDVSPPLRDIPPMEIPDGSLLGALMVDPGDIPVGLPDKQDIDPLVQGWNFTPLIPAPLQSFNGQTNISGVAPPDPVGDVGPNHYISMSNLHFAIWSKTGTLLYGPAANNTLWAGFGGPCQTENAGDPIVLHDQMADRWLLTQFTAAGPTYYNCVALSTSSDPTGTYYRWAVSTGSNFPDYPKWGIWPDAYYISTREVITTGGDTIGAYALNRTQALAGNPAPQIVSFLVTGSGAPYKVGNGLLPSDLDGPTLPPAGTPNYYLGSQDDGATYGAPSDALNVWAFHVDWAVPGNSTFTLVQTIPIAAYDTIPAFCSGRSCVPQPGTANKLDLLSYRQRPLHRAAYRNFGTHQSLVTNQSVEASPTMSGIRWWEIRFPSGTPTLFQEGTYAPGISDGIFRWMGSIAMDSAGNMALGYSAADGTATYPSVWYTGRLAASPAGVMDQGEGQIINGTGSQTAGGNRWGDYTSMNVDPLDDCTFWYVNEWVPTTSASGWVLRIGSFKFSQCGTPDFYLGVNPNAQGICAPANGVFTVSVGQISGFTNPVNLSVTGNPAGTTAGFAPNPVTPPGSSTLTIGNTGAAAPGSYPLDIAGTSTTGTKHIPATLDLFAAAPAAPVLSAPANNAINVALRPAFSWAAAAGAVSYVLEVDNDPGFATIDYTATVTGTSHTAATDLSSNMLYYWRVRATNPCGPGSNSTVWSFTTVPLPGDCGAGSAPATWYAFDFETAPPASGWTSSGSNPWVQSTLKKHGGAFSYLAVDQSTPVESVLVSPAVVLPAGHQLLTLQFWNDQTMEDRTGGCYDGGILEISNNGGTTWTHVPTTKMLTDPYNGPINGTSNPLNGLDGWCGDPQPWLKSVVDIDAYAGQLVKFRFRLGSDSSVGRSPDGWYLDDLFVQSCRANTHLFSTGFESGGFEPWSGVTP